jgi:hypothetical protein
MTVIFQIQDTKTQWHALAVHFVPFPPRSPLERPIVMEDFVGADFLPVSPHERSQFINGRVR